MLSITKRDGRVVEFDSSRITQAILKAMGDCGPIDVDDHVLAVSIAEQISKMDNLSTVEEIQDQVERKLMASRRKDVAKSYILYRRKRTEQREADTLIKARDLFNHTDNYLMKENANKKPELTNVQFSYLGGILATHYNRTQVFTPDVLRAHDAGAIHVHDMDMCAMPGITNCCLVNLYDCLVNGTVMNGVKIGPQTKFVTACTVATQIIQGVAGCQYGGITVTMSHLVPALKANYEYLLRKAAELHLSDSDKDSYVAKQLNRIVRDGVQTFMYQVNSMFTTQGQTPFLTVNLQMSEVSEEDKPYLAMIIEEVLKQRIEGFQDRYGNWVAPAFPKLIFTLCEDTMTGKYQYLRKLAAECNASRMAPDYISEKVMKEIHGHCFPSMGCLAYDTPVIMADGTRKPVQDIVPGDNVMGGDGTPRRVLDLVRGTSQMYRINQTNAESYVVNEDHILSLVYSVHESRRGLNYGDVVNIRVKDYLALPLDIQKALRGYKGAFELPEKEYPIDPYILGLWLGDGVHTLPVILANSKETQIIDDVHKYAESIGLRVSSSLESDQCVSMRLCDQKGHPNVFLDALRALNLIGNKHIPEEYFLGSKRQRSALLAGLINTDGWARTGRGRCSVCFGNTNYDLVLGAKRLADSLGYSTSICHARNAGPGIANHEIHNLKDYWHLNIRCFDDPLLMSNKRTAPSSRRDFSRSTISVEPVGFDNFYGFNIDGDHLFQLNDGTVTHNCRSFLSEWNPINNPELPTDKNKFYGRLNCGVVSLNLPYIAAESINNKEPFDVTLDKYASLVHKAHQTRLKRILNTSVDCAPLLWRDGVFARCTDPDAKIGDIVTNGYASVSLGYAGLYECLTILGYKNHWEGSGKETAFAIMQRLNDYCKEWSIEDNMRYGVYGTPMESGTYKFAKALQSIYPSYDRLYVTNSYHIPVFEEIDPFDKLSIEGEFQRLSKNGCISYVECADLTKNIEFIMQLQEHIYNSCMYAELNIKSCKCYTCGSEAPQEIDDTLTWYCPACGERRKEKLRHLYRICGYPSTEDSNEGRTSDVKDRFIHCDNHEV